MHECFHTSSVLDNGEVLVTGGYASFIQGSVELFDPSTGPWDNRR